MFCQVPQSYRTLQTCEFALQEATGKECGLHAGNSAVTGDNGATAVRTAERDLWEADSAVEALSRDQLAGLESGGRDKPTLVVLYAPWCPYSQAGPSQASPLSGWV